MLKSIDKITDIVKDVSEDKVAGEPEKPWIERKKGYIAHLDNLANVEPIIVSTADKIHNLTDMLDEYERVGDGLWEKFNASKDDELWFYKSFLEVIQKKAIPEKMKADLESLVNMLESVMKQG